MNLELLIEKLKCERIRRGQLLCTERCVYRDNPYGAIGYCHADKLLDDAIDSLTKEQKDLPILYTPEEVLSIGKDEADGYGQEDTVVVWCEFVLGGGGTFLQPARLMYTYSRDLGDKPDDDYVIIDAFGSESGEKRKIETYGKTWRCWTAKPRKEDRKAVVWK